MCIRDRHYLNHPQLPPTIASKQLLAAVGQSQLIQAWEKLFAIYDIHIGQILLKMCIRDSTWPFLSANFKKASYNLSKS